MLKLVRLAVVSCTKQTNFARVLEGNVICRWAGHSKWANIKHTKMANDNLKSQMFVRLTRNIKIIIALTKDPNPETNGRLASVIGQCRRANMPQSTITNAIKAATNTKPDNATTGIFQVRGPGRSSFLIEYATNNPQHLKQNIQSILKKCKCRYDTINMEFSEKGVLIASPLANAVNPEEEATEHAIESFVEEVSYDQEAKKLRFECSPSATWKAKKALETLGYVIDSAVVEYHPVIWAELSDEDIEAVEKLYAKLENIPEIMNITDNIA